MRGFREGSARVTQQVSDKQRNSAELDTVTNRRVSRVQVIGLTVR